MAEAAADRLAVLVLNAISASGLSRLPPEIYRVGKDIADPDAILVYPCLELIRTEPRRTPRGFIRRQDQLIEIERNYWQRRWREAGGQIYEDRMIAPVSDPVWEALSRFGVPHPPFDFNSGMGTRRIGRREAERLGVIEPGERVPPQTPEEFPAQVPAPELSPFLSQALQSLGLRLADGLLSVA